MTASTFQPAPPTSRPGRLQRLLARWNLGNLLFTLGLAIIGMLLVVPDLTGRRVARIENRAERTAAFLLSVAQQAAPLELASADAAREVEQQLRAGCQEAGFPNSDLPELRHEPLRPDPQQPVLLFATKHYWFMLSRQPATEPEREPAADAPFEVLAWPREPLGGGHTAFVFASGRDPVYSRNLVANYAGTQNAPLPGQARPRTPGVPGEVRTYFHGYDDERWIVLQDAALRNR